MEGFARFSWAEVCHSTLIVLRIDASWNEILSHQSLNADGNELEERRKSFHECPNCEVCWERIQQLHFCDEEASAEEVSDVDVIL